MLKIIYRPIGNSLYETKVIRSSIDRLEISLIFKTILRVEQGNFDQLYFLTNNAIDLFTGEATLQNIVKTLAFLNAKSLIQQLLEIIRNQLIDLIRVEDKDLELYQRYTFNRANGSINITKIVIFYTTRIAKADQEARYNKFNKEG